MTKQQAGAKHAPHGEQHHRAKLTDEIVREVRTSTEASTTLAKRYGVTREAISAVRIGRTWKHLL